METSDTKHTFIMEGTATETLGLLVAMTGMTESDMEKWQKKNPNQYQIIQQTDFAGGVEYMKKNHSLIAGRRLELKRKMFEARNMKVFGRL